MAGEQKIMGNKFVKQWAEALGLDPSECRRVVIDARVGDLLLIYVEKLGTTRMLDIQPPDPGTVQITVLDKE